MSNSALSSAKRRRTVGANDSPINSTSQVQESMQNNRPVSLQQAIHYIKQSYSFIGTNCIRVIG